MKIKLAISAFSILILSVVQSFAAEILVIQSYHKEYAWDKAYTQALKEKLGKDYKLTFFQMDTKRLPKSKYLERADAAWNNYLTKKPDLVILGDDNAVKFLGKRFANTKTPTVFLGINNNVRHYFENYKIPENITGVLERPLIRSSISNIITSVPGVKKILILFDSGTTSKASIDQRIKILKNIHNFNGEIDLKQIGDEQTWKNTIKNAKKNGYDLIFVGLYHTITDLKGVHVPAKEILSWTNKNTQLPLFGFWTFAVGKGKTIGGYVLNGYKQGEAAAKLVRELSKGLKPRIVVGNKGILQFSKSELKRWNIKLTPRIKNISTFVD